MKEMPMEEYIAGVVAGEMDLDWPIEALAAQAIIARTFTLQKIVEEEVCLIKTPMPPPILKNSRLTTQLKLQSGLGRLSG